MPTYRRRRSRPLSGGDGAALYLNFQNSTLETAAITGSTLSWTDPGDTRMMYNGAGLLQYAPHQLLGNANLGGGTGGSPGTGPTGWTASDSSTDGTFAYEAQPGGWTKMTCTAISSDRAQLFRTATVEASTTYTVFAYVHAATSDTGVASLIGARQTSGTDGDVTFDDFTTEGWYAVGCTMGAADTVLQIKLGIGLDNFRTGEVVISRPGVVKGLLPGVGVDSPARLSGPPLGRWIGTDNGDEPVYDPRLGAHYYDGSSLVSSGYWVEGERTNLVLYSQDFDNAVWGSPGATTITADDATAPDGTDTADLMTVTSDANNGITDSYTITASTNYAQSMYFKKNASAPHAWFRFMFYDGGSNQVRCWINVQTGAIGSSSTNGTATLVRAQTVDEGNDWFRVELVGTLPGTTGFFEFKAVDGDSSAAVTSVNGATIHIWGGQLELGSFMSSYIPTFAATATRSADDLDAASASWFNNSTGTLLIEWNIPIKPATTGSDQYMFTIDDGGSTDQLIIYNDVSADRLFFSGVSSAGDNFSGANTAADYTAGNTEKTAVAWKVDDVRMDWTSSTASDDTTFDPWTDTMSRVNIGRRQQSGGLHLFGFVKSIKAWPTTKSDAEVASLVS